MWVGQASMTLWQLKIILVNCIKLPVFIALIPFGTMPVARRIRCLAERSVLRPLLRYLPIHGLFEIAAGDSRFRYRVSRADRIGWRLFWGGLESYEPETTDALRPHLGHDTVFVDVGANTGLFSLVALASGVRHVLAIEPVPRIHAAL